MLRIVSAAIRGIAARTNVCNIIKSNAPKQYSIVQCAQQRYFGALSPIIQGYGNLNSSQQKTLLGQRNVDNTVPLAPAPITTPVRTVIKYSLKKGKRKTVKAVVERFYRLNWGIWIRTRAGRHKHLWRKTTANKNRLRYHVFVNATQSTLLDKMVTSYWRRPHYYVDDPYNPYHNREEFLFTRRKPLP